MGNVEGSNVRSHNNSEFHDKCITMCCNSRTVRPESRLELQNSQRGDGIMSLVSISPTQVFHQILE